MEELISQGGDWRDQAVVLNDGDEQASDTYPKDIREISERSSTDRRTALSCSWRLGDGETSSLSCGESARLTRLTYYLREPPRRDYASSTINSDALIMACCYIAAFCVGQLVKAYQFLDLDEGIRYNDEGSPLGDADDLHTPKHASDPSTLILSLSGLTCSACTSTVESTVSHLPGVEQVRVSLTLQQATIISSASSVLDTDLILTTIRDLGYDADLGPRTPKRVVHLLQAKQHIARLSASFSRLARGVAILQLLTWCAAGVQGSSLGNSGECLVWMLHVAALAVTLYVQCFHVAWIHVDGWRRGVNMNTLISLAMGLGSLLSSTDLVFLGPGESSAYYGTTLGLALVVVAGRYLDALSRRSGSRYLIGLYKPMLETQYAMLHPTRQVRLTQLHPNRD